MHTRVHLYAHIRKQAHTLDLRTYIIGYKRDDNFVQNNQTVSIENDCIGYEMITEKM